MLYAALESSQNVVKIKSIFLQNLFICVQASMNINFVNHMHIICLYVLTYTYICTGNHTRTNACMHARVHTHTYIHEHIGTLTSKIHDNHKQGYTHKTHIHKYKHTYTHTHYQTHTHTDVHRDTHTCTPTRMDAHTHTYHTHRHTHALTAGVTIILLFKFTAKRSVRFLS